MTVMTGVAIEAEAARKRLMSIALVRGELLTGLLKLATDQRQILVKGNHDGLADNIQAQDQSLAELDSLEKQEQCVLQASPADIMRSSQEFRRGYLALARESALTADSLKTIVQTNRELLDTAMQYVAFSLGAISNAAADKQSYDPNSDAANDSLAIMLDRKV
jgi:hypothetical protein